MTSFFENTPLEPPNAILGLSQECNNDPNPLKINLTIGAYRTEEGTPFVLPSIKAAEKILVESNSDHEYLVQDGFQKFNAAAQELMFGKLYENIFTIQGVAGTGALRLGADFLRRIIPTAKVAIPNVTWQNHPSIFKAIGFDVVTYRYLAADSCSLDFPAMLADIRTLPNNSILLLHSCAHNPTGCDPTEEEWQQVLEVVKTNHLLPFFDNAYQGFVSGDPEVDAYAVRLFYAHQLEMVVACSFSKNFGLYGERVGALHVVCRNIEEKEKTGSVLRVCSRILYSTCPSFGAKVVALILNDPEKKRQWQAECCGMATRLRQVREDLYQMLLAKNVKGTWQHVITQRGMFSFSGLPEWAIKKLRIDYSIYLLNDGRISLAGLNKTNLPRFVNALVEVLGTN